MQTTEQDREVWHRYGRGCQTLAEAYARKAASDEHRGQWITFGLRHEACCNRDSIDAIEHDHADANKLNVSHVARAIVELLGDTEPFEMDSDQVRMDREHSDQVTKWLMRHGKHWNDGRSSTEAECVAVDYAEAIDPLTEKPVLPATLRRTPKPVGEAKRRAIELITAPPSARAPRFVPPADSAIHVVDLHVTGAHGFAYQADRLRVTLIAPPTDGGQWTATWSRGAEGGFARSMYARLAIDGALDSYPDPKQAFMAKQALINRKAEYVWRGEITPERIAADHLAAKFEDGQTRGVAYTLTVTVADVEHTVRITDDAEVWVDVADQWTRCGELHWGNDSDPIATALAMATDLVREQLRVEYENTPLVSDAELLELIAIAGTCPCCLEAPPVHPEGCLIPADELRAAIERGSAITSLAALDKRGAEIKANA